MEIRILLAIGSCIWAGIVFFMFPHMVWGSFLVVVCICSLFIPEREKIEKYTYRHLSFSRMQEEVERGDLSMWHACALIARVWFFPFFMLAYIGFLFVSETHLRNIHYTRFFLSVDEYLLLALLLVSGIWWVSTDEWIEKEYVFKTRSALWWRVFVVGICVFAGISTWVVAEKTLSLWRIGHIISSSVWALIVLLGVMVFDESEE